MAVYQKPQKRSPLDDIATIFGLALPAVQMFMQNGQANADREAMLEAAGIRAGGSGGSGGVVDDIKADMAGKGYGIDPTKLAGAQEAKYPSFTPVESYFRDFDVSHPTTQRGGHVSMPRLGGSSYSGGMSDAGIARIARGEGRHGRPEIRPNPADFTGQQIYEAGGYYEPVDPDLTWAAERGLTTSGQTNDRSMFDHATSMGLTTSGMPTRATDQPVVGVPGQRFVGYDRFNEPIYETIPQTGGNVWPVPDPNNPGTTINVPSAAAGDYYKDYLGVSGGSMSPKDEMSLALRYALTLDPKGFARLQATSPEQYVGMTVDDYNAQRFSEALSFVRASAGGGAMPVESSAAEEYLRANLSPDASVSDAEMQSFENIYNTGDWAAITQAIERLR